MNNFLKAQLTEREAQRHQFWSWKVCLFVFFPTVCSFQKQTLCFSLLRSGSFTRLLSFLVNICYPNEEENGLGKVLHLFIRMEFGLLLITESDQCLSGLTPDWPVSDPALFEPCTDPDKMPFHKKKRKCLLLISSIPPCLSLHLTQAI